MKNLLQTICVLLVFVFCACQEEDLYLPEVAGEGSLQLKVNIGKENLINARAIGFTDAFSINLLSEANDTMYRWNNVQEVPESIKLKTGKYLVKVSSEAINLPAFDAVYYAGTSDIFEIGDGQVATVDVTARLANTKVSIQYADSLKQDFYDYFVRISDQENNYLTFGRDEIRAGYFKSGDLLAYVKLSYIGPEGDSLFYEKTQQIKDVQSNDHIKISIQADLQYGDGLFSVNTSDAVNQKEVVITFDEPSPSEDTLRVMYSENLATRRNGLAFASSYADDSMQYAQPKYDPVNDTIRMVYNLPTPDKAFDGRSTHWESHSHRASLPQWLSFDFGAGQAKTIKQYSLNVTQWGTPRSWFFQGSNDASTWDTLDARENETMIVFEANHFEVINQTAYQYYRILVTEATGLTNTSDEHGVNFVLIRELEMREMLP